MQASDLGVQHLIPARGAFPDKVRHEVSAAILRGALARNNRMTTA